jgi:hypothetical protein
VGVEEQVDEQGLDGAPVDGDLPVTVVGGARRVLQSVPRAFAAAQSARRGSSRSENSAKTGSKRRSSWSFTSS